MRTALAEDGCWGGKPAPGAEPIKKRVTVLLEAAHKAYTAHRGAFKSGTGDQDEREPWMETAQRLWEARNEHAAKPAAAKAASKEDKSGAHQAGEAAALKRAGEAADASRLQATEAKERRKKKQQAAEEELSGWPGGGECEDEGRPSKRGASGSRGGAGGGVGAIAAAIEGFTGAQGDKLAERAAERELEKKRLDVRDKELALEKQKLEMEAASRAAMAAAQLEVQQNTNKLLMAMLAKFGGGN